MNEEKFTPGPWVAYPHLRRRNHTEISADNLPVISIASVYGVKNQKMANARLIAAAPDMYEALKKLKECLENFFGKTEKDFFEDCDNGELYFAREYNYACNVLKKARGEE